MNQVKNVIVLMIKSEMHKSTWDYIKTKFIIYNRVYFYKDHVIKTCIKYNEN